MQLLTPTRTATTLARGNACAFLFSFLCVLVGMSVPTKTPTAIVAMSMGCLIFGWLFVATIIAHVTSENGMVCELPNPGGEFHALTRFPIVVRLENNSNRWPLLFLTAEIITACDGNILRSPQKFIGLLPVRSAGEFAWNITARKRGEYHLHGLEAGTSFPGSLLVRRFFFAFDLPLLALPTVYKLKPKTNELLVGQRQANGHQPSNATALEEFVGVREYRPGDNPRNVCIALSVKMPDFPWQLVVREYEDPTVDEVCVILDTAVPPVGSESDSLMLYRFEKSISFAVALCRQLCERKHPVLFIACQADGKTVEMLLKQPSKEIPILERKLARIKPIRDVEASNRVIRRQAQVSDAILLFVGLLNEPGRGSHRLAGALRITPEWQSSLVSEVVGE